MIYFYRSQNKENAQDLPIMMNHRGRGFSFDEVTYRQMQRYSINEEDQSSNQSAGHLFIDQSSRLGLQQQAQIRPDEQANQGEQLLQTPLMSPFAVDFPHVVPDSFLPTFPGMMSELFDYPAAIIPPPISSFYPDYNDGSYVSMIVPDVMALADDGIVTMQMQDPFVYPDSLRDIISLRSMDEWDELAKERQLTETMSSLVYKRWPHLIGSKEHPKQKLAKLLRSYRLRFKKTVSQKGGQKRKHANASTVGETVASQSNLPEVSSSMATPLPKTRAISSDRGQEDTPRGGSSSSFKIKLKFASRHPAIENIFAFSSVAPAALNILAPTARPKEDLPNSSAIYLQDPDLDASRSKELADACVP